MSVPLAQRTLPEGFKLTEPHCDGCFVAERDDEFAFIVYDGWDRRDKNGRNGGSRMWHRFVCNDIKCNAVMLVRWDVMARFVTRAGASS